MLAKARFAMSMFSIFNVSGSAVSAQSQRLNVVASNLANVDAVAGPDGKAQGAPGGVPDPGHGTRSRRRVRVSAIKESGNPGRRVHDPSHPSADAEGYVTHSNVNAVDEMVNMISASRSYQNNIEVMNTAKSLLLKTLQMASKPAGNTMFDPPLTPPPCQAATSASTGQATPHHPGCAGSFSSSWWRSSTTRIR